MSEFSEGGLVGRLARGDKDTVAAVLSKGEYRISEEAVKKYGPDLLEELNRAQARLLPLEEEPGPWMVSCTVRFAAIVWWLTFGIGIAIGYLIHS